MVAAAIPPDEEERLRTLYSYDILDTMEEESFDDICRLAASTCDTPIALITLLDRTRQWFKARVGLNTRETERDCSFCAHAILEEQDLLVVHDARRDARLMDSPLVLTSPYIRFYAGVVLHGYNGKRLGTLCVIDRVARDITSEQRGNLFALARQVEALLELRRLHCRLKEVLEQREQLARFVIHDLNNPLASLILNTEALLWDENLASATRSGLEQICEQLLFVGRLVKNFQDVAASGAEGLPFQPREVRLRELVENGVGRVRMTAQRSGVAVAASCQGRFDGFRADPDLLERVLDNLLQNAIAFAPRGSEVLVEVLRTSDGNVRLAVHDGGRGVEERDRERIFEPYVRLGDQRGRRDSRGLGLAFCRVAAQVHGGRIWVEPHAPQGSSFVVELPWSPPLSGPPSG
jgi:signal transduction histidine kinase